MELVANEIELPLYRHASKREEEFRLDEWLARLGSRRPGRKGLDGDVRVLRSPAGARRQAGCHGLTPLTVWLSGRTKSA
jgi:hypothetical protein